MQKLDPEMRFIGVGLVLGVVLILFFVVLASAMDLHQGFFGFPPQANHFVGR